MCLCTLGGGGVTIKYSRALKEGREDAVDVNKGQVKKERKSPAVAESTEYRMLWCQKALHFWIERLGVPLS